MSGREDEPEMVTDYSFLQSACVGRPVFTIRGAAQVQLMLSGALNLALQELARVTKGAQDEQ